jgi:hypothetical protein
MNADVRWITAMLDSPPESADASERFWLGVSGSTSYHVLGYVLCGSPGGLSLGAVVADVRPGWTVMRDPAGRSYCITGRRPGDV